MLVNWASGIFEELTPGAGLFGIPGLLCVSPCLVGTA